jgi:hypothetical protein
VASPFTMHSLLLLTTALLGPAVVQSAATFRPFKDSKCTQPLKVFSGNEEVKELLIDRGLVDDASANGHYYDNMTFPDSQTVGASTGQGSNIVYWHADPPNSGDVYTLMLDQHNGYQYATRVPGIVILNVQAEGCYYSAIEVSTSNDFGCAHGQ